MKCSNCGYELIPDGRFCGNCGAQIMTTSAPAINDTPVGTGAAQSQSVGMPNGQPQQPVQQSEIQPQPVSQPIMQPMTSQSSPLSQQSIAQPVLQPVATVTTALATPSSSAQSANSAYAIPAPKNGSTIGVVSLVLGVVALMLCWFWIIGIPCGIAAFVCGIIAISRGIKGYGIAGIALGTVAILASLYLLVMIANFCDNNPTAEECRELGSTSLVISGIL